MAATSECSSLLGLALLLAAAPGLGLGLVVAGERWKRTTSENAVEARCGPQDAFVRRHFDRSDWMYAQRERLASVRLVDLKLIGSHNAASYSIDEPFDDYSVCQNARIGSQLAAGVRYVDLRVGLYEDEEPKARVGHGPHYGFAVDDILNEVANFSRAHPKELLIVSVKDAGWAPLGPPEKRELIRSIETAFADMLTTADDWSGPATTTLGDVWARNRSVLVLYADSLLRSVDDGDGSLENVTREEAAARGLHSRDHLYDPWANTESADVLFRRLSEFYERRPVPRNRFYVAQTVLTASLLLTDGIGRLTAELQRSERIGEWLREHPDYNIVFLDFVLGVTKQERPLSTALIDEITGRGNRTL